MRAVGGTGKHIFWMGGPFMAQPQRPRQVDLATYENFYGSDPETLFPIQCIAVIDCNPTADRFGASSDKTSDQNTLIGQNGQMIWKQLNSFPFPVPLDVGTGFLLRHMWPDVQKLAQSGVALVDPEVVNMWITLEVLQYYDQAADDMEAAEKKTERRRKRDAIRMAVAEAVGAIIMSFAAPAIIGSLISTLETAISQYMDAKKRAEAAKDMAQDAQLFAKDSPAFATQVQKTADMLDASAAQQGASTPIPPEQQVPIPAAVPPAAPIAPPSTALLVSGGIVATGIAAIALFKP